MSKRKQRPPVPPLLARDAHGRWTRGASGNPKGRPPDDELKNARAAALPYAAEALETLAVIMATGKSESARVAAARELLDRAWGRPATVHPEVDETSRTLRVILRGDRGEAPPTPTPTELTEDGAQPH